MGALKMENGRRDRLKHMWIAKIRNEERRNTKTIADEEEGNRISNDLRVQFLKTKKEKKRTK